MEGKTKKNNAVTAHKTAYCDISRLHLVAQGFAEELQVQSPVLPNALHKTPISLIFFLGGRKDKAAMQTPQRCVASFLMGWLSNATKTSLPEGLCSLKLSRVHPLGGRQVKKKTWFWPRLLFEAIKKQYYLLHEQTNEKIR